MSSTTGFLEFVLVLFQGQASLAGKKAVIPECFLGGGPGADAGDRTVREMSEIFSRIALNRSVDGKVKRSVDDCGR